jgi:hypothetical protein
MADRPPKPDARFDTMYASTSAPIVEPRIHEPLLDAIREKTLVELNFRDNTIKRGEPHVYGVIDAIPRLLLFDDEHGDEPSWALIDVRNITQVKRRLNRHFTKRPIPPEFDPGE